MKNKFLILVFLLITYFQTFGVKSQPLETVDKIVWLTSKQTSPIKAYVREVHNKEELARAFEKAAYKYSLDIDYLIVLGWTESVFRNLIGDEGKSLGEMQVGVYGRKKCKCDMKTVESRIDCGACWLDAGRSWCGSLDGGLQAYVANTDKCRPRTVRALRKYNFKKSMIQKLKARLEE